MEKHPNPREEENVNKQKRAVEIKNRFQALATDGDGDEEHTEIGSLDVEMENEMVATVGMDKRSLRSAGRGKITIDSGAAESVLPADVVEGDAKRRGVRYVTANDGKMETWARRR